MTDHSSLQDSMIFYYIFDCNYKSVSNSQCRLFGNLLCSVNLLGSFILMFDIFLLAVRLGLSQLGVTMVSQWCQSDVILSPSACLY